MLSFSKVLSLSLAAALFFAFSSFSAAGTIELRSTTSGTAVDIIPLAADDAALVYRVNINALRADTLATASGDFAVLDIDGMAVTTSIGAPRLPVIRRLVEIPEGVDVDVIASAHDVASFAVEDLADASIVMPVQTPVVKLPGAREAAPFDFNDDIYGADRFQFEATATLGAPGHLRGHRVAWLTLRPVDYNPATGEVRVARSMDVTLRFNGKARPVSSALASRYADPRVDAILSRLAMPVATTWRSKPGYEYGPSTYLVIGPDALFDTADFQDFVAWKQQKGYEVVHVTVQEAGTTQTGIQAFIRNAYATWEHAPSYILLLGDTNEVPFFVGSGGDNPASDLYYQLSDDLDLFPDIAVGRFPARTAEDVANMVRKTLFNEMGDYGQPVWATTAAFLASEDNWDISQGTHDYVIDTYMNAAGFTSLKYYTHLGATTMDVLTAINSNLGIVTYSGHGGETLWADGPVVDADQVRNLINTVYPFVFSFACVTGSFDEDESFSETWLKVPHGGVAMWASSVNSYWDEDDVLERVMYDGFFAGDGRSYPMPWISGMTDYGKLGVWQQYGGEGLSRRYMEMYNLMGDPEQMIPTIAPGPTVVTIEGILAEAGHTLTFAVNSDAPAMLGVSLDGAPVGVGFTDQSGKGSVLVYGDLKDGDEVLLTVTGHNLQPWAQTMTVGVPDDPIDDDDDDDDWPADDDDDDATGDDDLGADDDDDKGADDDDDDDDDEGGCGC